MPKSFTIWRSVASPLWATAMTSARNSAGNGVDPRLILPGGTNLHRSGVNQTRGSRGCPARTVPVWVSIPSPKDHGLFPLAAALFADQAPLHCGHRHCV